jgi:hypothetical protein
MTRRWDFRKPGRLAWGASSAGKLNPQYIYMTLRHIGAKFPYRIPAAEGVVDGLISRLGGLFRGLGASIDEMGSMIQGNAATHETGEREEHQSEVA